MERLVDDVLQIAGNAWPFAYDYFVQGSRIGLFAEVPIVVKDGVRYADLHGTVSIRLEEPDVPDSSTSIAMVATVLKQDRGVALVCSTAPSFAPALAGVLEDVTAMFVEEVGEGAGVDGYVQLALGDRPILADPRSCLAILLPLVQHPGDGDRTGSSTRIVPEWSQSL